MSAKANTAAAQSLQALDQAGFYQQPVETPCLDATRRRPYALYVHGNNDTAGAVRAVETLTTGMAWRRVQAPLVVLGTPGRAELDACWELGAAVAAGLTLDP